MIGLTKTLAREWGPFNVNCNAIAFGWIATRMTQDKELGEKSFDKIPLGVPTDLREKIERLVPLGRAGTPRKPPAEYSFSPHRSRTSKGHVLHVDGGLDM